MAEDRISDWKFIIFQSYVRVLNLYALNKFIISYSLVWLSMPNQVYLLLFVKTWGWRL